MSRVSWTSLRRRMLRRLVYAVGIGATFVASAGCGLEVGATYPGIGYDDYPPDGYIATTEPVYFDGRPTYWYGGRWNYREGGRWSHYDREPPGLYQRRMQGPPVRRTYEPSRGRPAAAHFGGRPGGRR
jgi:hypothetical protein